MKNMKRRKAKDEGRKVFSPFVFRLLPAFIFLIPAGRK
jgi:hypothetical protein